MRHVRPALIPRLLLLAGLVVGCLDKTTDPPPGGDRPGSGEDTVPRDTVVRDRPDSVPSRPLDSAAPVVLERLFESAEAPLRKPVWFGPLPGRRGGFIALEQHTGTVVLLRRDSAGAWTREDFLRLEVEEQTRWTTRAGPCTAWAARTSPSSNA